MVGHEAKGVDVHTERRFEFHQCPQVIAVIRRFREHDLSIMATLHDMVRIFGQNHPSRSWHFTPSLALHSIRILPMRW